MSKISSYLELAGNLFAVIREKISRKSAKRKSIASEIRNKEKQLKQALSSGRISDAGSLCREIHNLYDKYNHPANYVSTVGIIMAFVFFLAGCFSEKAEIEYTKPVVIGERIQILAPGETVTVPKLIKPAKKWYLVDDIGIVQWLGIPVDTRP